MSDHNSTKNEATPQIKGQQLSTEDGILFNDWKRPLTFTITNERTDSFRVQRQRGSPDHPTIIELEGNNTEYHLICTPGSGFSPMLYKEADWDSKKTNRHGENPMYSCSAERV
jgi:hypothetical protein